LLGRCGRNHKPPLLIHALPSSGRKRLQKIFLFSGVFRLPFRPLAGETTTSTKENNESTDSIQKNRILLVLIAPALVAVERPAHATLTMKEKNT
jgi:hypothetical protein